MSATIEKQLHDLANQVNGMAGAAWMLLAGTGENEQVYALVSELERAMNIVCAMQQIVSGRRLNDEENKRESA